MRRFFVVSTIALLMLVPSLTLARYEGLVVPVQFLAKNFRENTNFKSTEQIREAMEKPMNFWQEISRKNHLPSYPRIAPEVVKVIGEKNQSEYTYPLVFNEAEKLLAEQGISFYESVVVIFYNSKVPMGYGFPTEKGGNAMIPIMDLKGYSWPPDWKFICHEMGHAFGLRHHGKGYLMSSDSPLTDILTPQDVQTLAKNFYFNLNFIATFKPGLNFFHLPLADYRIKRVSDLWEVLEKPRLIVWFDNIQGRFKSYSEPFMQAQGPADIKIEAGTGLVVVLAKPQIVSFYGPAWPEPQIHLQPGMNLIGLALDDRRIKSYADLGRLAQATLVAGDVAGQIRSWPPVTAEIHGGHSLLVVVKKEKTIILSGSPWRNDDLLAAPSSQITLKSLEKLIPVVIKKTSSLPATWGAVKAR